MADRQPAVTLAAAGLGSVNGGSQIDVSVANGTTINFTSTASDPDGNHSRTRTWVNVNNQGWAVLRDDASASYNWAYALNGVGTYQFHSRSIDASNVESATAVINLTAVNRAPAVTAWGASPTIYAGSTINLCVRGQDPDGNARYFNLDETSPTGGSFGPGNGPFNASAPANNGSWDLGSSSGDYTRTLAMNFPNPGTFTFRGAVNDDSGWYYSGPFSVTVIGTNNPYFNSYGATAIQVGATATVNWNATDADGDFHHVDVWITQWGSPYWDYLGAYGAAGSTAWSSSPHFNTANGGCGTYLFVVRAVDNRGGFTDAYATFDINRPPGVSIQLLDAAKSALPLNGNGRAQLGGNQSFYLRVNGSDPDGNLLRLYSRIANPSGVGVAYEDVAVSGASGSHDFGPYNSGSSFGVWNVWAHAQDSAGGGYQENGGSWWLSQTPDLEVVNRAPGVVAHNIPASLPNGSGYNFVFDAADADSNLRSIVVHYRNATTGSGWRLLRSSDTVANGPWNSGLPGSADAFALVANGSGNSASLSASRSWTPDLGPGNYEFHLRSMDQTGTEAWTNAWMNVLNRVPTVTLTAAGLGTVNGGSQIDPSIANGSTIAFTSSASDPDGNYSRTRTWVNANGQGFVAVRDDANPNDSWTYPLNGLGTYQFHSRSIDAEGAESATAVINITATDRAPTIGLSASPATIAFGQTATITSVAADPDGNLAFHGILALSQDGGSWLRSPRTDHSTGWGNHPTSADLVGESYTSGVASGATDTRSVVHRPSWTGTITYHSNAHDGSLWESSWYPAAYAYLSVSQAAPNQSGWMAQSWSGTGPAPSGAYNVTLTNPYSNAVAAPTGAPSFSVVSASGAGAAPTGGSVTAATVFYPGSYVVRCSYPGDSRYFARSWDATFTVANRPPTASFSVDRSTAVMGEAVTVTMTVGDPDGNLDYTNLWVSAPAYGWRWIQADNSVATGGALDRNRSATAYGTAGTISRSFTFTAAQGAGTYTFALAAVDASGARTDAGNQVVAVSKIAPAIGWATPAAVVYGTPLSAAQLNASTGVAGSFSYSPALGAVLPVPPNGAPQTLAVTFTPTDAATYCAATATVPLVVNKAPLTVVADDQRREYGRANPALTVRYTGFKNGDTGAVLAGSPTLATAATVSSDVGVYPITVAIGTLSANNYDFGPPVSGSLAIDPQAIDLTFAPRNFIYDPAEDQRPRPTPNVHYEIAPGGVDRVPTGNYGAYYFRARADGNYTSAWIDVYWSIICCTANVHLADLHHTYDGQPKRATATTTEPSGLVVKLTYDGSETMPVGAGEYVVLAEVHDAPDSFGRQWGGEAGGNGDIKLVIAQATQAPLAVRSERTGLEYGAQQILSTVGGSGNGAVTYEIVGQSPAGGTLATISGQVLTANASAGSVTIRARKASGTDGKAGLTGNYLPTTSANDVTIVFARATQAPLVFAPVTTQIYGTAQLLSATGGSGTGAIGFDLAAQDSAATPGAATIAGSSLTANTGVGWVDVRATRAGDDNYHPVSATVRVNLAKATPTVTWSGPADLAYGTPLGGTQLNATASVPGSFAYSPGAGAILAPGPRMISVAFTPAAAANFDAVSKEVPIEILRVDPALTWTTPAEIAYGTPLSATQCNATADVPGTFTYSPAVGAVLFAGTQTLSVTFAPTDAVNHRSASKSVSLAVRKRTPTITWAAPATIVHGMPLSALQLNATADAAGAFAYLPPLNAILPAGEGQTLVASFAPADSANFNPAFASVPITVTKADPVIAWPTPAAIPYRTLLTGTQLNATANVPGSFMYTPTLGTLLEAGDRPLSVVFTPVDDRNYTPANRSVTLRVDQADPIVAWPDPAAIVYGTPLGAAQLDATADVPGTFVYTPAVGTVLNAGNNQTLSVIFAPTDAVNYRTVTRTATITVNQATPAIAWNQPAPIVFGTALSSGQLNATAGLAGTFSYRPPAGTVLNAGGNQPLGVTFTPTDTQNYTIATGATTITVNQATPAIAWSQPAPIVYGTALSSMQLNATSDVAGTFSYRPSAGTVLNAGGNQTLGVTFTPADTQNYTTATGATTITVNQATPVIAWNPPAPIVYGTGLSTAQLNATASVAGTFSYDPAAGTLLNAGGNRTLTVLFTPNDTLNYTNQTGTTTIAVNKATPPIAWNTPAAITYPTPLSAVQLSASAGIVAGVFVYSPAAGAVLDAGDHPLRADFAPADSANYNPNAGSVSLTVNPAPQTITASATASSIGFGESVTFSAAGARNGYVWSGAVSGTAASSTITPGSAGSLTASVHSPAGGNYARSNDVSVRVNVEKVTPIGTFAGRTVDAPHTLGPGDLTATFAHPFNDSRTAPTGSIVYSPGPGTALSGGTHPITATYPGDTNYAAATVTATFVVKKATPSIAWNPAAIAYAAAIGDAQMNATASAPGHFDYAPCRGVRAAPVGAKSLTARFTPDDPGSYYSAEATRTIAVNRAPQSVAFAALPDVICGAAPIVLSASATSGLPIAFTLGGGSPATLVGSTLTVTGTGTVTVSANQAGDSNYEAAASVSRSFSVAKAPQTISFTDPASIGYRLDALASSGLPVMYALESTGQVFSRPEEFQIIGHTLVYTGNSTRISVRVTASQSGDQNYEAATPVSRDVTTGNLGWISRPAPSVSPGGSSYPLRYVAQNYWQGDQPPGGVRPVAIFVQDPSGAWHASPDGFGMGPWNDKVMASGALSLPTPGLWHLKVVSGETSGDPLIQIDPVSHATEPILEIAVTTEQTIAFSNPGTQLVGAVFNLGATSSAALPIEYTMEGPATLSGPMLTVTGPGLIAVTASQSGNAQYQPAKSVTQRFNAIAVPRLALETVTAPPSVGGDVTGSGWALDYFDGAPVTVKLFLDGQERPGAVTASATRRDDVQTTATANGWSARDVGWCGWTFAFNTSELEQGNHTVYVTATNSAGRTVASSPVSFIGGMPPPPIAVITFDPLPNRRLGDPPFALFATSSSGAPVRFEWVGGPATLSGLYGETVTLGSTSGRVTIRATCPANWQSAAAVPVERSFALGVLDSDGDGIDDEWETAMHLDPLDASDAGALASNGTSYLENYRLWQNPGQPVPSATQIPVEVTVFGKPAGANASVTVTLNRTAHTFGFGSTAIGQWQGPIEDVNRLNVTTVRLDAELGKAYPMQVASVGMVDFVVRAKELPDVAPSLRARVAFDGRFVEAISKTELAAQGGTANLAVRREGIVPFATLDTSRFETMRLLTFGLGGSRSGETPGQIVFSSGAFIYGAPGTLRLLKGPGLVQVWEDPARPSHFQVQAPSGYVDVLRTRARSILRYFANGSYPDTGGYKDFSGATPLATYAIDGLIGGAKGGITQTVGGVTSVLEVETERAETALGETTSGTGAQEIRVSATNYSATTRVWAWHAPGASRTALTVAKATTLRTVNTPAQGGPASYTYNPIDLAITRYLGPSETAVASFEQRNYLVGDTQLVNSVAVRRGLGGDQPYEGRVPLPGYSTPSGLTLAISAIETKNGRGGGTITEYYSGGTLINSGNNLDGQPGLAIGEPKFVRQSFGHDPAGSATDLISTYTYNPALVDGQAAPDTVISRQGATEIGRTGYTYAEANFNGAADLPAVGVTVVSQAGASAATSRSTWSFSRRLADLDRRSRPISVTNPDGTKVSYAYQRGTLGTGGIWSAASDGPDLLIAELNGKPGTGVGAYPDAISPIDPLDLEAARSTVTERILDREGRIKRESSCVYTGSAFARLTDVYSSYDAFGNLIRRADSADGTGRIFHEAGFTGFRKDWEKDEQGITLAYTYDDYDRLRTMKRTGASDSGHTIAETTTTYAYDGAGRLESETMTAAGTTERLQTTYTYDTANRPTTRIQFKQAPGSPSPGNLTTSIAYDSPTKTVTTLPGGGTKIEETYADGRARFTGGTAVPDTETTYAYNPAGQLETTRTFTETLQTTKTVSDWLGRPVSVESATWAGGTRVVRSTYTGALLTRQDTSAGGTAIALARVFNYDDYGRLQREALDANGNGTVDVGVDYDVREYEFAYQTGAPGHPSNLYRYDGAKIWPFDGPNAATGRYASQSYAQLTGLGASTAAHVVSLDFDRNRTETISTVDRAGKKLTVSTSTAGTTQTLTQVFLNGLPVSSTNAQGQTTRHTYDALGRPESTSDPRTGVADSVYYENTTLAKTVTAPDTRTTGYGYDAAGRVNSQTVQTDDGNKTACFRYDAAGNLTHQWGDTVNPVKQVFNDLGQKMEMHTYRTGTWTGGPLPAGFAADGDRTTWAYQASTGLLTSRQDPVNPASVFEYTDLGQVKKRTDARGWVTRYEYDDPRKFLSKIDYTGAAETVTTDVSYVYDRARRPSIVTDAAGQRTFGYYDTGVGADDSDLLNKSGRLKSETLPAFLGGHVATYDYQYAAAGRANGALAGVKLDTGSLYAVAYGYDDVLRLNSVAYNGGTPFAYDYVPNSNLIDTVAQFTGPSTCTYQRDYDYRPDSNRLDRVRHFWNGAAPTVEARLDYNTAGLRSTEQTQYAAAFAALLGRPTGEPGVHVDYSYNARAEVEASGKYVLAVNGASWSAGGPRADTAREYRYDSIGNRTGDVTGPGTYAANALNQYTAAPGFGAFAYDANGNLTSDGRRTYAYDAENRLITVTQSGATKSDYAYDHLGRRIAKSDFGWNAVAQLWTQSAQIKFLYDGWNLIAELDGGGTILRRFAWGLDVSGTLQGAGGVGGLLVIDHASAQYRPIYDASHNVAGLYDGNGNLSAAYEYDPFGNIQTMTGGYAAANPFRSATKYTDDVTGLVYYGGRFYSPALGRFLNRDPIGEQGGANLYAFCGNDGVNRWDYLGMEAVFDMIRRTGGTGGSGDQSGQTYSRDNPENATLWGNSADSTPKFVLDDYRQGNASGGDVFVTDIPFTGGGTMKGNGVIIRAGGVTFVGSSPGAVANFWNRYAGGYATNSGAWTDQDRMAAGYANAVYGEDGKTGGLLKSLGIPYYPKNGFAAALYQGADGKYYLAMRGTQPSSGANWWANLKQSLGFKTPQYEQAVNFGKATDRAIAAIGRELIIVGHSLGGGLAGAASYATGRDAITFNAAGLSSRYATGNPGDMRSHYIRGDILSVAQDYSPFIMPSAAGTRIPHDPSVWYRGMGGRHMMDNFLGL